MYGFFKSASEDIIDTIDCDDLNHKLTTKFETEGEKLEIKLKKIIKTKEKFQELSSELSLEERDLLYILVKNYPNIFNHRLIKFIRKTYLFPEEDI